MGFSSSRKGGFERLHQCSPSGPWGAKEWVVKAVPLRLVRRKR